MQNKYDIRLNKETVKALQEEYYEKHRKLWLYTAIQILRSGRITPKRKYFEKNNLCKVRNYCYACEFKVLLCNLGLMQEDCEYCLIDWGYGKGDIPIYERKDYHYCFDEGALYTRWANEYDYRKAALLAYKISKMPMKNLEKVLKIY